MPKAFVLSCLLIAFLYTDLNAQSITRSSLSTFGGSAVTADFEIIQTAGQASNTAFFSGDGSVHLRQGFQQPPSLKTHFNTTQINFGVYPNPSDGRFIIHVNAEDNSSYTYSIYDISGRILSSASAEANQHIHVDAEILSAGMYFIRISKEKTRLAEAKIIIY